MLRVHGRPLRTLATSTKCSVRAVRRVACCAVRPPAEDSPTSFELAALRLQQLVNEASWDAGDAVRHELGTYTVGERLTFITNCSTLASLLAFTTSWLCGEDAFGGMTLTADSAEAAMQGIGFALPLLATSLLSRTRPVRAAFPLLEDLHAQQAAIMQPLLAGMEPVHLLIVATSLSWPMMLALLPAMHGVVGVAGVLLHTELLEPLLLSTGGLPAPLHAVSVADSAAAAAAAAAAAVGPGEFTLPTAAGVEAAQLLTPPLPLAPGALTVAEVGRLFGSKVIQAVDVQAVAAVHTAVGGWQQVLPLRVMVDDVDTLLPAIISGFMAAYVTLKQLAPKASHVHAIRNALQNCDRYFRLTVSMDTNLAATMRANQPPPSPPPGGPITVMATRARPQTYDMGGREEDVEEGEVERGVMGGGATHAASEQVADAFKRVSVLWLMMRRKVCHLAYMLTALNVVYYVIVWREAGDLAAPLTTATIAILVELAAAQAQAGGGGGGGDRPTRASAQ